MTTRTIAALLVAAFVVFLAGAAFWLVREFEQPLAIRLKAVAMRRRRWMWIHVWMLAGTLVSIVAMASLVSLLRADGDAWLATVALVLFVTGALAFLAALLMGLGVTPGAAAAIVRTGVVPAPYLAVHRVASGLHAGYMMLSYATFVLLGSALLRGSLVPEWVGWVGVAAGASGLVGFPLLRGGPFAPPIIAHSFGLLVGIVMLTRS